MYLIKKGTLPDIFSSTLVSTLGCLWTFYAFVNKPFPSCFEPHYESEAKCKVFVLEISFHSYANKTSNFHMKNFALSLAFIVKLRLTRKWPKLNGTAKRENGKNVNIDKQINKGTNKKI